MRSIREEAGLVVACTSVSFVDVVMLPVIMVIEVVRVLMVLEKHPSLSSC
jgi:hypothetical protein